MDLEEAKRIYRHPKGHSEDDLRKCLRILNENSPEPKGLQKMALDDAKKRLKELENE